MLNQRIEMKLADDTTLIAETEEKSDYPSMNIYYKNAEGEIDEMLFAEYNPDKPIGRRVMVAAYRNDDDEPKHYQSFHYCFKPTFQELYEICKQTVNSAFTCRCRDEFIEIVRKSDDLVIFRDFSYDNDRLQNHVGHNIVLTQYGAEQGIVNVSVECEDCNEVLYSVDRPKQLQKIYRMIVPSMSQISKLAYDVEDPDRNGCIGYSKVDFGTNGNAFHVEWYDKMEALYSEAFNKVYLELIFDYLSYNLFKDSQSMKRYCEKGAQDRIVRIKSGEYATEVYTDDYTFFIRIVLKRKECAAYVYAYANQMLYTSMEAPTLPVQLDFDCNATIQYVKHLKGYQQPHYKSLDRLEEECWSLFRQYAEFVGVKDFEGTDFTIANELSRKFMTTVEKTFGVDFPICDKEDKYKNTGDDMR